MAATIKSRVIRANRREAIGDQDHTAKLDPYNCQSRSRFLTVPRGTNFASGYSLEGRRFLRSKSKRNSDGRSRVGRLGRNLLSSLGVGGRPKRRMPCVLTYSEQL